MKRLIFTVLIILCYLAYGGLILSQYDPGIFPEEIRPETSSGYHDYKGVTHVSTSDSTGSQSAEDVIQQANLANLDFLFLTDLNTFKYPQGPLGYYEKVLVFRAGEYSYFDSRLLFYDMVRMRGLKSLGQSQVLFADMLSQTKKDPDEGMLILSHPFKKGFAWTGDYPPGLNGIELINFSEIWETAWERSKISFLWSALIYPFNPRLALLRLYSEPIQELDLWDRLNRTHPTVAVLGTEATARAFQIGPWVWRFPSYRSSFELASNHILLQSELTSDADNDSRKIFRALKKGQSYLCLDLLGDPRGFVTEMRDRYRRYPIGSQVKLAGDLKLVVKLPRKPRVPFSVIVYKDGSPYMSSDSEETSINIHNRGVYRVAVRVTPTLPLPDGKRSFTWIYTNSFYVR